MWTKSYYNTTTNEILTYAIGVKINRTQRRRNVSIVIIIITIIILGRKNAEKGIRFYDTRAVIK